MPFETKKNRPPQQGLKDMGGQKSMFEGRPKTPTPEEFRRDVQSVQDIKDGHNKRTAELFVAFLKMVDDKTISQNKNIIARNTEDELLKSIMRLASDINNDPNEVEESMGSLACSAMLFKACLSRRERINELEYRVSVLQKKLDTQSLTEFVKKEIALALAKTVPSG